MARLDRLGPAKEVAQIGAAIGREFSHALLAAVVRKPEAELTSALDRLIAAGLLFRQGTPPHATYLFKHALVQDAAYGTLLREPRRTLHARIAETLESQFGDIAENQPELLARHPQSASALLRGRGWPLFLGDTAAKGIHAVQREIGVILSATLIGASLSISDAAAAIFSSFPISRATIFSIAERMAIPSVILPPLESRYSSLRLAYLTFPSLLKYSVA